MIHQLGLSCSSRCVSAPSDKSQPGVDHFIVLNSADHTSYRSATMRRCYLALDRPDLQFPSKELARWMQTPAVGHLEGAQANRQIHVWTWTIGSGVRATSCDKLRIRLTSCSLTQIMQVASKHSKSISSSTLFHVSYMLRSTSTTQGLSLEESEFHSGEGNVSRTWSSLESQRSWS